MVLTVNKQNNIGYLLGEIEELEKMKCDPQWHSIRQVLEDRILHARRRVNEVNESSILWKGGLCAMTGRLCALGFETDYLKVRNKVERNEAAYFGEYYVTRVQVRTDVARNRYEYRIHRNPCIISMAANQPA